MKAHGVHYTPPELASFLARRILGQLEPEKRPIRVLDPACGDGELLAAFLESAPLSVDRLELVGVDRDELAIARARTALASLPAASGDLAVGDFLSLAEPAQLTLSGGSPEVQTSIAAQPFDVVISNPPYVRTQVLGAGKARELAGRFELSGRVDLYQAFVAAMTPHLRAGGVLGLLCSNRFLSVQAGEALRALLRREYELCEIFDLGDTKLFAAAVLPAIVIARRRPVRASSTCLYVRAYEYSGPETAKATASSVFSALEEGLDGIIEVSGRRFEVERGHLKTSSSSKEPWRVAHEAREGWLATIARNAVATFADVGEIRVGIKTTADRVFIRSRWDDLAPDLRPEPELLHPLLTHHIADRWRVLGGTRDRKTVLYPHVISGGRRCAIDLRDFPRARSYLEAHRGVLASRRYVTKAGREWYEIWVPQQPDEWAKPKIVWPDISDVPRFFLDNSGAIVNGDCYWIALQPDVDPHLASLLLAVANSSFALAYYDAVCGNRLYAGRRRFITQYVKRFPMPALDAPTMRAVHELVERLRAFSDGSSEEDRTGVEAELDALVWQGFGLRKEVRR